MPGSFGIFSTIYEQEFPRRRDMRVDLSFVEAVFRPPDALLPERGQMFAVQVQIDQREVCAQPVMVLRYPPVAHLVEAEDAFQDAEDVFYFRSNFRLRRVLTPSYFVHIVLELRPAASHILRVWRGFCDRLRLALIAAVAPYFSLLAVE